MACVLNLALYALSFALMFNLLNLALYITFCVETYRLKLAQNKSTPSKLDVGPYVIGSTVAVDVSSVEVSTISAYSTNTMRGNQSLLCMTMSTSFMLMALNQYYNETLNTGDVDYLDWIIIISYSMLIFVGLFPSNDIIKRNQKGELIRDWNIFFFTKVPIQFSGVIHGLSAIIYLLVPTCIDIYLNRIGSDKDYANTSYLIVSALSLSLSLLFFFWYKDWCFFLNFFSMMEKNKHQLHLPPLPESKGSDVGYILPPSWSN